MIQVADTSQVFLPFNSSFTVKLKYKTSFLQRNQSSQDEIDQKRQASTDNVNDSEEYDTYPPPEEDFVYENPYVTDEEMRQLSGKESDRIKPRKPSSAYVYYLKRHRNRIKELHPTWPFKKIIQIISKMWLKASEEEKAEFVKLAEADSLRYNQQMSEYMKSDSYKKSVKVRKKKARITKDMRMVEKKGTREKEAFELFAKDHGGSLEDKKLLWSETDDNIKEEYFEKLNVSKIVTTRSKRQVKLPSKLSDSVLPKSSVKESKISNFDNFVKSMLKQNPERSFPDLKRLWDQLTETEKLKYSRPSSTLNYKALDAGNLFFDDDDDLIDENE